MCRTFNCGIGMVLVVSASDVDAVKALIGEEVFTIGSVIDLGKERVVMNDLDTWI
jgi:phosphoribosylaminoimidazole (AIR) synthetase